MTIFLELWFSLTKYTSVDYKYHPTGNIQWAGFDHPSTFLVRLYLSLPQTVRNKQKK